MQDRYIFEQGSKMSSKPARKTVKTIAPDKTPMPVQDPHIRRRNFSEVALGYTEESALREAERCLSCKHPKCVDGCPVCIDIPEFIQAVAARDYRLAYDILKQDNLLPAVCGRVCPQEVQCESTCIAGLTVDPIAIGRLERFVADYAASQGWKNVAEWKKCGWKIAIVGSGPAGLTCAGDLARCGCDVTVFEALHAPGGVLRYGIPEFRLPNAIIDREIEALRTMGVEIQCDKVIGRLFTIPCLMKDMGFDAVFIGTGAGAPRFAGIPGEQLNGLFSANEYLTRINLMSGYRFPEVDTPVGMGRKVAVIGGGNTAMDACRASLRMGADEVYCVYRRTITEAPARAEEVHHALEEGVEFLWLTSPIALLGDAGWIVALDCQKMELGEPDESGRRRPVPIQDSEFRLDVDTVVYALGTTANPIIARTTPGLKVNKWGYIKVDDNQMTSIPGVFAGGDIVTGSATVILAMGAGRKAARGILKYLEAGKPMPANGKNDGINQPSTVARMPAEA
jgi:glutamate synthase (NADPH/NADH) small chain